MLPNNNRPDHFKHSVIETYGADGRPKRRDLYIPDKKALVQHEIALRVFNETDVFNPVLEGRQLPGNVFVDGSMPGTTLLDGVLPHRDNVSFYKLDIRNAFPSVETDVLLDKLVQRSYELNKPDAVRAWLHDFITEFATTPQVDGLPLGAPASPYLFNFYLGESDKAVAEICDKLGLTYTRYLDDITISSPKPDRTLGEDTRRKIREAIESTPGMSINRYKVFRHQRDRKHVTITGVALYPDGRIQPKPELLEKTLDAFHDLDRKLADPNSIFTYSDLGRLDGYHGVLIGMSVEPYSDEIKQAISLYHELSPMVRAAIEISSEPSLQERIEMRRSKLADYVIAKAQKEGIPPEILWQVSNLKEMFPDWGIDTCILVASMVLPMVDDKDRNRLA